MTIRRSAGDLIVTWGGHVYSLSRHGVATLRDRSDTLDAQETTGFPGNSTDHLSRGAYLPQRTKKQYQPSHNSHFTWKYEGRRIGQQVELVERAVMMVP